MINRSLPSVSDLNLPCAARPSMDDRERMPGLDRLRQARHLTNLLGRIYGRKNACNR